MNLFAEYIQHGWKICKIEPGTKGPRTPGWNQVGNAVQDPMILAGAGLLHAYSGTCALDIDRLSDTEQFLQNKGIDLLNLLSAENAVQISSGRPNRRKLIYALPAPLPSKSFCDGAFELRCGATTGLSAQDVLPPSIHPDTGKPYEWIGDWRNLPPIPPALLAFWQLSIVRSGVQEQVKSPSAFLAEDIKDVLSRLDPNCGYDEWVKIGMALHHETSGSNDGLALWDEWSAPSEKYAGIQDLQMHWSSFGRSATPVTIDSIRRKDRSVPTDFQDVSTLESLFAADPIPKPQSMQFMDLAELFARPEPEWIVKGVLPEAALGVIYGPHSTGKTFAAVDLALSISLGQSWRGRPVKQGKILYIAAEDDRGVQIRLAAGLAARGATGAPIRVLPTAPILTDKTQQAMLLEAVKRENRPSIVFFDTLAAITPGADENSGKEMGELIGYCYKLHKETGALILLVHHEGKTDGRGPRGWSGLGGAFEIIWKLSADDLQHELEIEKVKNAAKGDVFQFRLLPVANSCIVEWI